MWPKVIFSKLSLTKSTLACLCFLSQILDWSLSQPGFDPSFGNLACQATLKICDITKSVCGWQYICSPTPEGLSSLVREVMCHELESILNDLYKKNFKSTLYMWFKLPWPENPANTYSRHTETLDSCFNLIRSHQQCIPWSPPLEIEAATTDCRAESLLLSHESILHTSDAKLTSHCNCAAN